eukprot:scaffold49416_cov55-Cyclotella_meneghiniana.AAC.4
MFSNDDVCDAAAGGGGSCVAMMGWTRLIRCCFFVLFARSTSTTDFSSDVAGTMNILRKEEKDEYELIAIVSKITRNLNLEKVCQHSSVRR